MEEEILIDDEYLSAVLTAIKESKKTIDMEVYIFQYDDVGKKVLQALHQASLRGVKIRLLIDGIGSMNWDNAFINQIQDTGIQIKVYHPLPWRMFYSNISTENMSFIKNFFLSFSKINSRNHRKVCIIDDKIVLVSSANITNYLIDNNETGKKWREMSIKLTDIDTTEVQFAFDKAWGDILWRKRFQYLLKKRSPNEAAFKLNYSWLLRHQFYKSLLNIISSCQKRIWVGNAYFLPDIYLLNRLIKASKSGVDVRILLPEKSDVAIMPVAASAFYSSLCKNGAKIFEYTPTILHEKILILDDCYFIGTANLDYRSFKHNLEVNVEIQTNKAKEIINKQFLADLGNSHQIRSADIKNQPWHKKMLAFLILWFKYFI